MLKLGSKALPTIVRILLYCLSAVYSPNCFWFLGILICCTFFSGILCSRCFFLNSKYTWTSWQKKVNREKEKWKRKRKRKKKKKKKKKEKEKKGNKKEEKEKKKKKKRKRKRKGRRKKEKKRKEKNGGFLHYRWSNKKPKFSVLPNRLLLLASISHNSASHQLAARVSAQTGAWSSTQCQSEKGNFEKKKKKKTSEKRSLNKMWEDGITGLSLTVFFTPRRGTKTRVTIEPSSDLSAIVWRKGKGKEGGKWLRKKSQKWLQSWIEFQRNSNHRRFWVPWKWTSRWSNFEKSKTTKGDKQSGEFLEFCWWFLLDLIY